MGTRAPVEEVDDAAEGERGAHCSGSYKDKCKSTVYISRYITLPSLLQKRLRSFDSCKCLFDGELPCEGYCGKCGQQLTIHLFG